MKLARWIKTSTKLFPSFLEYDNEAKMKDQNSNRLTDSKNELVVTKGEECGKAGRERGREKGLRGIMFSTHGVGDQGKNSVAQRR